MLQQDDLIYGAGGNAKAGPALAEFRLAARLSHGVCFTESGEDKKLKSLQMLAADPAASDWLRGPVG